LKKRLLHIPKEIDDQLRYLVGRLGNKSMTDVYVNAAKKYLEENKSYVEKAKEKS